MQDNKETQIKTLSLEELASVTGGKDGGQEFNRQVNQAKTGKLGG